MFVRVRVYFPRGHEVQLVLDVLLVYVLKSMFGMGHTSYLKTCLVGMADISSFPHLNIDLNYMV